MKLRELIAEMAKCEDFNRQVMVRVVYRDEHGSLEKVKYVPVGRFMWLATRMPSVCIEAEDFDKAEFEDE